MEKVHLTKTELALLDALIADMQEDKTTAAPLTAASSSFSFIGGITRITQRVLGITFRITPVTVRLAGRVFTGSLAESDEAKQFNELFGKDGSSLSVDKLIELRKAAHQ